MEVQHLLQAIYRGQDGNGMRAPAPTWERRYKKGLRNGAPCRHSWSGCAMAILLQYKDNGFSKYSLGSNHTITPSLNDCPWISRPFLTSRKSCVYVLWRQYSHTFEYFLAIVLQSTGCAHRKRLHEATACTILNISAGRMCHMMAILREAFFLNYRMAIP